MNEYSILFHLLTQKDTDDFLEEEYSVLGSTEENICAELKFTGKTKRIRLFKLLEEFTKNIRPFGIQIQKNPFNQRWYASQTTEIQELFQANPFAGKHRLSATLCVLLALALTQAKEPTIKQIKELRSKKNVRDDLDELEAMNFVKIKKNRVFLHPKLGYYLDIDQFIKMINEKAQIFKSYEDA